MQVGLLLEVEGDDPTSSTPPEPALRLHTVLQLGVAQ